MADNTKWASATVTLAPVGLVIVTPGRAILEGGQTQQFTANAAVNWSLLPANVGSITAAGLYTAPATVSAQQTVVVVATRQDDPTKAGVSILTLLPAGTNTLALAPLYSGRKTGNSQTLTAVLADANRAPIAGAAIAFVVTGANPNAGSGTTDASGVAAFTYTGANAGADTVQASFGAALSNTASVTWVQQSLNNAPVITAGAATYIPPDSMQLSATVTDDGLPAGSSLAFTWTRLSGPADVTFENPQAASTTATFLVSGRYVLELSASDGELTATAQWTVDMTLGAPVHQGWIAGFEDGASVSGLLPISVAPGVTLASGVLKYYPDSGTVDDAVAGPIG